jgi:glutamate-1-semialdehyde 2,1-aminomutase
VGFEGAAGMYNVEPDLLAFGKIIGGGLPVGAYGGKKEVMAHIAPDGPVYQAGTLSGNPVAMAAGYAQLKECLKPNFYQQLEEKTARFVNEILSYATAKEYQFNMYHVGSVFWLAFSDKVIIRKSSEIDADSMKYFTKLHAALLERGVYLGPSGYEVGFISEAHTNEELDKAIAAFKESLDMAFA